MSAENVIFVGQDGKITPTLVDAAPILSEHGDLEGAIAVIQDITALSEVERLREEVARLEERERMEMDLHDEVIGSIFALGLQLEGHIDEFKGSSPSVVDILGSSIDRLQRINTDIREHILSRPAGHASRGSLRDALTRVAIDFQETTPIAVHIEAEHDVVLPEAELSAALHVVWESLNNAVKHAQASKVVVRLSRATDEIIVEVQDDGIGLEAPRPLTGNGHGLRNMSERALRVGGTLVVEGTPGEGTRVVVRIPTREAT